MSYDIYLIDPVTRETLELDTPHHMRGGTYQLGCTTHLNVTYNYAEHFVRVFPSRDNSPMSDWERMFGHGNDRGVRMLYGMTGAESIPVLDAAIAQLGDDVSDDYWAATEGNAKRALIQLRALAAMRPDGVWDGD